MKHFPTREPSHPEYVLLQPVSDNQWWRRPKKAMVCLNEYQCNVRFAYYTRAVVFKGCSNLWRTSVLQLMEYRRVPETPSVKCYRNSRV
ncbi:hypothetical protein CEXT_7321 [Caerostris extrusa]|uniref:Uncharacterized protein n=1 Tax=Caerostris extrusa TaxID=172846 RepID=A0AAV4XTC7_CAEEX|nr:hypothetical protein CEXT_7321 [Caerostris extrusa]